MVGVPKRFRQTILGQWGIGYRTFSQSLLPRKPPSLRYQEESTNSETFSVTTISDYGYSDEVWT